MWSNRGAGNKLPRCREKNNQPNNNEKIRSAFFPYVWCDDICDSVSRTLPPTPVNHFSFFSFLTVGFLLTVRRSWERHLTIFFPEVSDVTVAARISATAPDLMHR
jgi:hypothetical protein